MEWQEEEAVRGDFDSPLLCLSVSQNAALIPEGGQRSVCVHEVETTQNEPVEEPVELVSRGMSFVVFLPLFLSMFIYVRQTDRQTSRECKVSLKRRAIT